VRRHLGTCLAVFVFVAPSGSRAQLAAPGEVDPQGRVLTKLVVKTGPAANTYPAGGLDLYIVSESGTKRTVRTNTAGVATIWLPKAPYRIVTPKPYLPGNEQYTWDLVVEVKPGIGPIYLGDDNRQVQVAKTQSESARNERIQPRVRTPVASPVNSNSVYEKPGVPSKSIASARVDSSSRRKTETAPKESTVPASKALPAITGTPASAPRLPAPRAMIEWAKENANSDEFYKDGYLVRVLVHDSIALSVTAIRTDELMWVYLSVSNQSGRRIEVQPELVAARVTSPKPHQLRYRAASDLAKGIERKARIGAALMVFAGALSTNQTVTEVNTTGHTTSSGTYDTYGTVRGREPSSTVQINATTHGHSRSTTAARSTIVTTEPDYIARANAAAQADQIMTRAYTKSDAVLSRALLANTVMPSHGVAGAVFFERDKKATELIVTVRLNNQDYVVPLRVR
jgi:hypothetical protein